MKCDPLAEAMRRHTRGIRTRTAAGRGRSTDNRARFGERAPRDPSGRSALPMNVRAHYPGFKIWAGAQADVDRVTSIWCDCLMRYGGPYLFGEAPCAADAMYAPVCTRFATYDAT